VTDTTTLEDLVSALDRAASELRSGDLDPQAAADLVEQCAHTAGQAAAELDRLLRAAAQDPIPGQDQLL
jgi:acetyl-CoA acetyltransferase